MGENVNTKPKLTHRDNVKLTYPWGFKKRMIKVLVPPGVKEGSKLHDTAHQVKEAGAVGLRGGGFTPELTS